MADLLDERTLLDLDRTADYDRLVVFARDDLAYHQSHLRAEADRLTWQRLTVEQLQQHVTELRRRLAHAEKMRERYLAARSANVGPR